ncbi:MAG: hypothetical protein AB7I08_08855 [Thermoleophilia bacterium]
MASAGRLAATALGAAALALAAAAPASADSIAYVKAGDIWLTTPDTSRTVQVTARGGYSHVSQADDGTLIGLNGQRLHRLSPAGALLADFGTPVSDGDGTAGSHFTGPYDPVISPDGTKVAYTYYWTGFDGTDPTCLPPLCIGRRIEAGVGYSHADRDTPWDTPGLGRQSGWVDPSWIDGERVLLSDKAVRFGNLDVITDRVGDGLNAYTPWFDDTASWYMGDGEMNLRAGVMAFVGTTPNYTTFDNDQIRVYRLGGDVPALPEACFAFRSDGPQFSDPSLSPDGRHVVWADLGKGIMIGDIPDLAAGCAPPSAGGRLVVPDAISPDWGPADVPRAGGGGAPAAAGASGRLGLRAVGRPTLRRALAGGLRLRVVTGAPGRLTVAATRAGGRARLAGASARVGTSGAATARLRFPKAAARSLRGRASVRLRVTAVFRPAAGGPPRRSAATLVLRS